MKKRKLSSYQHIDEGDDILAAAVGCDTKAALNYVRSLFRVELFENCLPPIILHHQLYSIVHSRTVVDKELGELRDTNEARLFKLGSEENMMCIIFLDEYKSHVYRFADEHKLDRSLIERFLSTVVTQLNDVSFTREKMVSFHFTDADITRLVKACVLTVRDVDSWWLSVPRAGVFVKSLMCGRRALEAIFQRCKYREILRSDLEMKRLPKAAKLGMLYHIHDLIGADRLESVTTTSGSLLRLRESTKKLRR